MRIQTMVMGKASLGRGSSRAAGRGTVEVSLPRTLSRTPPSGHQTDALIQTAGPLRGSFSGYGTDKEPRSAGQRTRRSTAAPGSAQVPGRGETPTTRSGLLAVRARFTWPTLQPASVTVFRARCTLAPRTRGT